MSAIKRYMEDVIATTTNAIYTEAGEELKAYGDYEDRFELDFELFGMMSAKGARAVWDMVGDLIGDMPLGAKHPLLDEARNQILTLIPFGELARDLSDFFEDYDPYEFRNCFDDMYESIEANIEILETDRAGVLEWLNECLGNMDEDPYWADTITTCNALIARVKKADSFC